MRPNLDNIFGIHETALKYRGARADVLASNIANAETPNYRARDIRFEDVLAQQGSAVAAGRPQAQAGTMMQTRPEHFGGALSSRYADLAVYREPMQGSLDQNTVDTHAEYGRFAENSMRYQASLRFLNGRISGIMKALKGE